MLPIITKSVADKIVRSQGESLVSLDLGLSFSKVAIKDGFAHIADQKVPLDELKRAREEFCYIIKDGHAEKLAFFSDETRLYYKLLPTRDWPTVALSSTPMHRHTRIGPKEDTMLKIRAVSPVKGRVLDTCCGLGYTAIMALKSSKDSVEIHTFERDNSMLLMASMNPYSQKLFSGMAEKKIILHEEDVCAGIKRFPNGYFDRIIHDPPTPKRSPELYFESFCSELHRVLKSGGLMYFYCPAPGKLRKTNGPEFSAKVLEKLRIVGFRKAEYDARSSGIRAVK